jgi:glycosyltransferase involved in cell wall biosynthesis
VKVLLVGVSAEARFVAKINEKSRSDAAVSVAAIKYSRLIFEGFRHHLNDNCEGAILVPIGMYPTSRILCWKSRTVGGWYYLPFVNLLLLKQVSIALGFAWFVLRWAIANRRERRIVVFTCVYLPFLVPFTVLKRLLKVELVSFVPDLPEYEFSYVRSGFSVKRVLVPAYIRLTQALCGLVDHFVLVSAAMKTKFAGRSSSVLEGFVEAIAGEDQPKVSPTGRRSVMYAGALLEKFGVGALLAAFTSLEGDYELWVLGSGEMEDEAREAARRDPRIHVFGIVPNREVLELERRATLLVNPRFTTNDFTRYSFPSKILEYMASGRPVLTTRIGSIPADYHDKLWFIEDESVDGIRDALDRCLKIPDGELSAFGRRARQYVLAEKNNVVQIAALLKILDSFAR